MLRPAGDPQALSIKIAITPPLTQVRCRFKLLLHLRAQWARGQVASCVAMGLSLHRRVTYLAGFYRLDAAGAL